MKVSIITPNFNGERFLEQTLDSVLRQREPGIELEYLVIDGGSCDHSLEIIGKYRDRIDVFVSEPDQGPASAINKGLRRATGNVIGWLNSDDVYHPGALRRAVEPLERNPSAALCFGRCRIIDEHGLEIRRGITRFKEAFFPISSRFTIQSINYISQPAMFFRRSALERAGFLREDLKAAFDYDLILRLWRQGGGVKIPGPPVADFRWHPGTISGSAFRRQFKEEFDLARADAGAMAPQTLLHWFVRWGIVGSYSLMQRRRARVPA